MLTGDTNGPAILKGKLLALLMHVGFNDLTNSQQAILFDSVKPEVCCVQVAQLKRKLILRLRDLVCTRILAGWSVAASFTLRDADPKLLAAVRILSHAI